MSRDRRSGYSSTQLLSLLHHRPARASRRMRLQLDLAKRRLILGDVLLQHVEQRLRLLRADVNALEILYGDIVRGCLV